MLREEAHPFACVGDGGHRPAVVVFSEDRGDLDLEPAQLQGIFVVLNFAPIFSEKLRTHAFTFEVFGPVPPRVRVKLCLYSPRWILWVTFLTYQVPSNSRPTPRRSTSLRGWSRSP